MKHLLVLAILVTSTAQAETSKFANTLDLFYSGTAAVYEQELGIYAGRCFGPYKPNSAFGAALGVMELRQDDGSYAPYAIEIAFDNQPGTEPVNSVDKKSKDALEINLSFFKGDHVSMTKDPLSSLQTDVFGNEFQHQYVRNGSLIVSTATVVKTDNPALKVGDVVSACYFNIKK